MKAAFNPEAHIDAPVRLETAYEFTVKNVVQIFDDPPYRLGDLRDDGIAVGGEDCAPNAAARSQRFG